MKYSITNISSNVVGDYSNTSAGPQAIYTITTGDNIWIDKSQIYNSPSTTTWKIDSTWPEASGDFYPKLPNALGVIYVEEGKIKCRTPEGEDIILGEMGDGDEKVTINIIATIAKRLLEKEKIEA